MIPEAWYETPVFVGGAFPLAREMPSYVVTSEEEEVGCMLCTQGLALGLWEPLRQGPPLGS